MFSMIISVIMLRRIGIPWRVLKNSEVHLEKLLRKIHGEIYFLAMTNIRNIFNIKTVIILILLITVSIAKNVTYRYEQVDAVVATFPKAGNAVDNSVTGRLNGLRWLATHGASLPASVERILVMDATDLRDLPLRNNDPNLPVGIDIEAFWAAHGRKKTRVLLRHGENARAILAAEGAMRAAAAASEAATRAREAIESGEAEEAAEAAIECQEAAFAATAVLEGEVRESQDLRRQLVEMGVIVEVIKGAEPIDVMNHLGTRNSYKMVVWRSGCWGNRGVQAIMDGAFQWVSAHLAVDAGGGKYYLPSIVEL